jgi:ATP-dependent Lon protease
MLIPIFPLGLVLLPEARLPLHIFEERYKAMIAYCLEFDAVFGVVYFNGNRVSRTGCTARIREILKQYDDGRMDIITQGQDRFVIHAVDESQPYLQAEVEFFDDEAGADEGSLQGLLRNSIAQLDALGAEIKMPADDALKGPVDAKTISFLITANEGFSPEEKQRFLKMTSTAQRLSKGIEALTQMMARKALTAQIEKIIGGNGDLSAALPRSRGF